jgi:6-phosphogluconate dehydrogenase
MDNHGYEIGLIGLGVMGRNLLLNMADHGFAVAGYDREASKGQALRAEAAGKAVQAADSLAALAGLLRRPRALILLVPAGSPVDAVIGEVLPHLSPGDLLIDSGNSHFTDTDRRMQALAETGVHFLGVGISGGEAGARHGPSLMPGGPRPAYERVRPVFEAVAARVHGEPCVAYLGPGSAGHFVKMVHNGIEYGVMQLLAETYDLMKRGLGLTNDDLQAVYERWNQTELNAYLVEITAHIFRRVDDKTGQRLIDLIRDVARQKGTGLWTTQEALNLQVPVPTIDLAVALRDLSGYETERKAASELLRGPERVFQGDRQTFLEHLRHALSAGMVLTYAQGLALLRRASAAHGYHLNLAEVARIWRGGCIIRAALLEPTRAAYQARPDLPNLLLDPHLAREVTARQHDLRAVVATAAELGIAAGGLMASLAYYDAYRSARLPANLIQAQRDYFGAHTYERVDEQGTFHTRWGPG